MGAGGLFLSAVIHDLATEPERAVQILTGLASQDPKNMKYPNEIGRIELKRGNLKTAQQFFEKADEIAPLNIQRLETMASLYLKTMQTDKAAEKYSDILQVSPEEPERKFSMYSELLKSGDKHTAQQFCQTTSSPQELVRYYNNRGVLLAKSGQYKNAIEEYGTAESLMPKSREIYRILYNSAISHINLKSTEDIQKAHQLLLRCVKLKPDYDKAITKLALTAKFLNKKQ